MQMWIGCLAAYNNGRLHGEWFDISTDADENAEAIARVLASSPVAGAEEYAILDYVAPDVLARHLGENPTAEGLADAAHLVETIESHWPDADDCAAVMNAMLDGQATRDLGELADGAEDWISERYAGEGETLVKWCEEFLDDSGFFEGLPDARRDEIQRYFDFESYARDLRVGGDIFEVRVNGRVLVFWTR